MSITQSDGTNTYRTIIGYYSNGNLRIKQDPNNLLKEFFYDAAEQAFPARTVLSNVRNADGNPVGDIVKYYEYDTATGILEWEQDPEGNRTYYEYDILNRMTKIILPDDDGDMSNNPYREYTTLFL